jgi:hypothetical protein
MLLRKSPKRTRALLAANRGNSRKSTGPRTELGKWHSAGNAVRHYRRTRPSSCIPIENREIRSFEDFLSNLREAIRPADNAAGTEAVLLNAARVWRVKRSFDRWIETRTEEDWLVLARRSRAPAPRLAVEAEASRPVGAGLDGDRLGLSALGPGTRTLAAAGGGRQRERPAQDACYRFGAIHRAFPAR